jgi:hypothetical protein
MAAAEAAVPSGRREMSDEIERLQAELTEQCRLNGMGSERELALMALVDELEKSLGECTGALETADREIAARNDDLMVAYMSGLYAGKAQDHSCHEACPRAGCVNRRLREELAALKDENELNKAAVGVLERSYKMAKGEVMADETAPSFSVILQEREAAMARVEELERELATTKYALQLDEDLIGQIQKIIAAIASVKGKP